MEPLFLLPAGKDYLWGGNRLKDLYGKQIDLHPLAETWECSVHPDGPSIIKNGIHAGEKLSETLARHPEYLGTRVAGVFPVLVKLIDAEQDLSVQVHPDDEFARIHEADNGKTEMWYILDAKPGATLVYGFAHDVTIDQIRDGVETGTLSKHLQHVPVRAGDVFFITPGTIHAIGAGVLLAEIQENSNVTYRVYDYNRRDKDGRLRPLHFDKAAQILKLHAEGEVRQKPRLTQYSPGYSREVLGQCTYFGVERVQLSRSFSFTVSNLAFQILLCIGGEGCLETREERKNPPRFKKGDCIFLPAGIGNCRLTGESTLLRISC